MAKRDRTLTALQKLEEGLVKTVDAIKRGAIPLCLEEAEKDLERVRRDIEQHIARQGQPVVTTTTTTEYDGDGNAVKITVVETTKDGNTVTTKKTVTRPKNGAKP